MAIILHEGLMSDNPLRIDQSPIQDLVGPYLRTPVVVHFACREISLSWSGRGVLAHHDTDKWSLSSDGSRTGNMIPLAVGVGFNCVLSVVPDSTSGEDSPLNFDPAVDDLVRFAKSLAAFLVRAKI